MLRGTAFLFVLSVLLFPAAGMGAEDAGVDPVDVVERIDALFERGKEQNYHTAGMELLKESLDLCLGAVEKRPDDYEVLWRCTRSAYKFAEAAQILQLDGWEEVCKEWGKKGLAFSERAQRIDPERVEGYFWETACIGVYADATGPFTAIKEGFYEKSKKAMARAYELDKAYNDYDPVFGSAMFYIALPFPLKDKKKALKYYREFEKLTSWTENLYVRRVHAADLLMTVKPKHYKQEARKLLEKVLSDPHPRKYYHDWALKLKGKLD
jgi:tetratricopeptide (TPR) repeat protein